MGNPVRRLFLMHLCRNQMHQKSKIKKGWLRGTTLDKGNREIFNQDARLLSFKVIHILALSSIILQIFVSIFNFQISPAFTYKSFPLNCNVDHLFFQVSQTYHRFLRWVISSLEWVISQLSVSAIWRKKPIIFSLRQILVFWSYTEILGSTKRQQTW